MINLLQIVDTVQTAVNAATQTTNPEESLNLFDVLQMGGLLMIPLVLLFFIAIFVFTERLITVRRASKIDPNFMNIVRDHIMSGNVVAARSFAKNTNNPVARIIDKGIQRIGKTIDSI